MKKLLVCFMLMQLLVVSLSAQNYLISKTKTVNDEIEFSDIRNACFTNDVMSYYYSTTYARDEELDLDEGDDVWGERNTFSTQLYVEPSFRGAIECTDSDSTDLADTRYYFENTDNIPDLFNSTRILEYMTNTGEFEPDTLQSSAGRRGQDIGYILHNASFIADCIWYYENADTVRIREQLAPIAEFGWDILQNTDEWGNYTGTNTILGITYDDDEVGSLVYYSTRRIQLACAVGYAGLVLDSLKYVDCAEYQLFEYPPTNASWTEPGWLGLYYSNSGFYTSGIAYFNSGMFYDNLYFTAMARSGIRQNPYDRTIVTNMIKQSLNYINPEFSHLAINDAISKYISSSNPITIYSPGGLHSLLAYNYQCDNFDVQFKERIEFYYKGYNSVYPTSNPSEERFPRLTSGKYYTLYSYRTGRDIDVTSTIIPEEIQEGVYTDEELTILRSEINTIEDYIENPTLIITHENSYSPYSHNDGDQGSFQLWYKGKQLLIDPGYSPGSCWNYAREWLSSPYAHNNIMVNPDWAEEALELEDDYWNANYADDENNHPWNPYKKYEPVGRALNINDSDVYNPAKMNYIIENNNIIHSSVYIPYHHEQIDYNYSGDLDPDDNIDVYRNYYQIDGNYFLIFDDIQNCDNQGENNFVNQLHFALYPETDPDNLVLNTNGSFSYTHFEDDIYLHGSMGCLNNIDYDTVEPDLPQGILRTDPNKFWEHKRLKIVSNDKVNEQLLTILVPSESSTNPIESVENYSIGYGVNYDLDTNDPYETYTAVYSGDTFFRFFQDEMQFNTSANFFLFKTNEDCSDIKKLILNGDNSFEVHDLVGTRFPDVLVFDSDYDSEEVIAEWSESNELEITTLMSFTSPIPLPIPNPKYKILRCGVLPENLFSKTHYYSNGSTNQHERGTIGNNIESLAFDDNYFYVNYGYSDLVSENLLTSDLTIHQGVFDGITIQGVTQFGTGDIVLKDEIRVPFSTEIVFLPGSQPQLDSDFHLIVDGDLTALGTAEDNIIFDRYSSTNWNKIEITNSGNSNMEFCKFQNAQFPLYNRGYIEIENCEFLDNSGGIYLDNPTGYQIEHSIINNCSYGILIKDSHILMYRSAIKNNLITNNNYGLWFYNASGYVEADTIFANKYAGIMANRGSNPVIVGSSISSTYYNSNNYPEIKISGSSYPIVDRNENDIIFGNGHSIYNMDTEPRDYRCSENWWGTTNELAISNSFYPLDWLIDFIPISQSPNVGYNPWSGGSLFEEGLLAESNEDLVTAKIKYMQSIDENPESIKALWSLNRLINCSETETEYYELQQYYNQLQIDYPETFLANESKLDEIFCKRLLGNYQDAITEYEVLLDENLSFIDSVFTQLDIVYTYMEASSGGNRANVTFQNSNNALSSVKQAEEKEIELWDLLESQVTDGGIYSPEISKSILHRNYPNPFNPSTTISFSIPEQSKIQVLIYNIKGQKVKTVTNESFDKGNHSVVWNGVDDSGKNVSSGVYFYNLNVNGTSKAIKKCLLLK